MAFFKHSAVLYQIGGKRLCSICQLVLDQTFEHHTTKYDRDRLLRQVKVYNSPFSLVLSLKPAKISSEDLLT
jgi:hypothetical protein